MSFSKNQIIHDLFTGQNFNSCISKMEPEQLREDLRQEVILIICELPEEKIIQLFELGGLEFYTVRIILNQIKSSTSPFAKKYRNVIDENLETCIDSYSLQLCHLRNTQEIPIEDRQLKEMVEDIAVEEVDKLYWYKKGLINLYMQHGNYRAIEEVTTIPFGSCYKTIKKSFAEIKPILEAAKNGK